MLFYGEPAGAGTRMYLVIPSSLPNSTYAQLIYLVIYKYK